MLILNLQQYTDLTEKIHAALTIYPQMAQALNKIGQAGGVFPDMKNSNWLFDSGKLLIGDDKSLRWHDGQGCVDVFSERSQWYGDFIKSPEYMPPEVFKTAPISVDAFYAFSWGKNLYEFLVADPDRPDLSYQKNMEGPLFNFNYPLFRFNPDGFLLKQLIIDMVRANPEDRITLQEGLDRLAHIQLIRSVRDHIGASIKPPLHYGLVQPYINHILQLEPAQLGPYAQITPENLDVEIRAYLDVYRAECQAKFNATIQEVEHILVKYPNEDIRQALVAAKMERQSLDMTGYEQFEADLGEILLAAEQVEMGMAAINFDDDSEDEDASDDKNDNTLR